MAEEKGYLGNSKTWTGTLDAGNLEDVIDVGGTLAADGGDLGRPAFQGWIDGNQSIQVEISHDGTTYGDPFVRDLRSALIDLDAFAPVRKIRLTRSGGVDCTYQVVGR